MRAVAQTQIERIPEPELVRLLEAIFLKAGASPRVAGILARNCVACERDGSKSHGVFRMPGYVASIRTGWADPAIEPVIEDVAPSVVRVDARNGFAQPALEAARPLMLEKVRANGVVLLAIRGSHHLSALWPDVEPFACEGLVAISVVNSFACTVPFGGHRAVLGTNPLAYAIPRAAGGPLVVDLATSAIPNGDVQMASKEGRLLPEGVAVDGAGRPTRDPDLVLREGALVPFGGHKGAAISLLVEVLGAALSGGKFSYEVDWSGHPGAQTPHTGQTLILIDPDRGNPMSFAARVEALLSVLGDAGMDYVPGARRYEARAEAARRGIALTRDELAMLRALA